MGDAEDATKTGASPGTLVSSSPERVSGITRTVHVRCFGGFAVEVGGAPVDLGPLRPRARALLRFLAAAPGQCVHRERLVDALWPGADLSAGTRRLQVAVSSVRQLLEHAGLSGSEMLTRRGDAYALTLPAGSTVDVRSFEQGLREAARCSKHGDILAAVKARESALAMYTGDLLPEDGPAEHIVGDRERLQLAAAAAAATQARDNRELGRTKQALDAARLSVQLDRYQDLAWDLLAELLEESGDLTAAAHARIEHTRAQSDLDVIPF